MTKYDMWLKRAVRRFKKKDYQKNEGLLWMSKVHYSKNERYATDGSRAHVLVHGDRTADDGDHALNWDNFGRIDIEDAQTVVICTVLHIVKVCQNALAFVGRDQDHQMQINLLKDAAEFSAENGELGQFAARLKDGSSYDQMHEGCLIANPFVYHHEGKEVAFWINAKFVQDALSIYPVTSSIRIMINKSLRRPIFIQPLDDWKDRQIPESIIMLMSKD